MKPGNPRKYGAGPGHPPPPAPPQYLPHNTHQQTTWPAPHGTHQDQPAGGNPGGPSAQRQRRQGSRERVRGWLEWHDEDKTKGEGGQDASSSEKQEKNDNGKEKDVAAQKTPGDDDKASNGDRQTPSERQSEVRLNEVKPTAQSHGKEKHGGGPNKHSSIVGIKDVVDVNTGKTSSGGTVDGGIQMVVAAGSNNLSRVTLPKGILKDSGITIAFQDTDGGPEATTYVFKADGLCVGEPTSASVTCEGVQIFPRPFGKASEGVDAASSSDVHTVRQQSDPDGSKEGSNKPGGDPDGQEVPSIKEGNPRQKPTLHWRGDTRPTTDDGYASGPHQNSLDTPSPLKQEERGPKPAEARDDDYYTPDNHQSYLNTPSPLEQEWAPKPAEAGREDGDSRAPPSRQHHQQQQPQDVRNTAPADTTTKKPTVTTEEEEDEWAFWGASVASKRGKKGKGREPDLKAPSPPPPPPPAPSWPEDNIPSGVQNSGGHDAESKRGKERSQLSRSQLSRSSSSSSVSDGPVVEEVE
ncbi:hypothetical protein C8A00DRAFT_35064 [Chaetomidium leptoderma]|uniref:Uncharacterized protein n=1 Tax=Chaetomidium leptoderma TaxID=669021 RepID=A0AAN6VL68_9PEZI|nr:hypothetical protein C8A00DRAFT_35064 [Chaetomidium leptoderma]